MTGAEASEFHKLIKYRFPSRDVETFCCGQTSRRFGSHAQMAEWSKALHSSCSIYGFVGSNLGSRSIDSIDSGLGDIPTLRILFGILSLLMPSRRLSMISGQSDMREERGVFHESIDP